MRRTKDVELVNRLLGRDFPDCDSTELLANPLNVCLIEGENGAMFAWRGPGIYEIHLFYEARGKEALNLLDTMLDTMRADHAALTFWALIPEKARKVRMFARLAHFLSGGLLVTQDGPNELFVSEHCQCHSPQ